MSKFRVWVPGLAADWLKRQVHQHGLHEKGRLPSGAVTKLNQFCLLCAAVLNWHCMCSNLSVASSQLRVLQEPPRCLMWASKIVTCMWHLLDDNLRGSWRLRAHPVFHCLEDLVTIGRGFSWLPLQTVGKLEVPSAGSRRAPFSGRAATQPLRWKHRMAEARAANRVRVPGWSRASLPQRSLLEQLSERLLFPSTDWLPTSPALGSGIYSSLPLPANTGGRISVRIFICFAKYLEVFPLVENLLSWWNGASGEQILPTKYKCAGSEKEEKSQQFLSWFSVKQVWDLFHKESLKVLIVYICLLLGHRLTFVYSFLLFCFCCFY